MLQRLGEVVFCHLQVVLRGNRLGVPVRVRETVYPNAGVLQHGGPEVGQWGIFLRSHAVLTVFESLESAAGEQEGHIRIPVSGSKAATTKDQAVVEDRSALGI